jgi:enamine deaminase RidA (YjgF/YER057c/UK114 family)
VPEIRRFRSRLAVLPPGARIVVSGQAEPGASLAEAARKTLESLGATLKFLGLDRSRVVQVKAFIQPIEAAADVEKEITRFFGPAEPPPSIYVEWRSTQPLEIELVASARDGEGTGAIVYLTPPALKPSPLFSRVARAGRGPLIFVSGLYGPAGSSGARQVEAIFESLKDVLSEAGGDLRHLAKATYYVADDDSSRALNEIRPRYYDAKRPPAASKISVAGVGSAGRSITVDMIGVPATEAREGPPEYGKGLKSVDVEAGWISVFDGATDFGWSRSRVKDGLIAGGQTTSAFGPCAIRAVVGTAGTITAGGKDYTVEPGVWSLDSTIGNGAIRLGEAIALSELAIRPIGLSSILPAADLKGWARVAHPRPRPGSTPPAWRVENGALRVSGGPGGLEYKGARYGDLVLQVRARARARYANGGVFFRGEPGQYLLGYEAQIYNRCEGGDPAQPSVYATGAIDDRQNARRLVSRDFEPFVLTVIARGPHLATWVSGHQVTDWTDARPPHANPRQGRRLEPGTIQLQAHDTGTDVEFLDIRISGFGGG